MLVVHQDQWIPIVPGLRRDLLGEGDALVIKPKGNGKFKVVTQVTPMEWANLAGVSPIILDGMTPDSTLYQTLQRPPKER